MPFYKKRPSLISGSHYRATTAARHSPCTTTSSRCAYARPRVRYRPRIEPTDRKSDALPLVRLTRPRPRRRRLQAHEVSIVAVLVVAPR